MIRVFDASALIAWLKHEPGAAATRDLLRDASSPRYAHAVNLCEVYYHFVKLAEEESVAARLRMLARSGLVTRDDIDADFWQDAARVKAAIQRVSLADCFAIAFARRVGGTVVTADHGEFDLVVARGICSVTFIR